MRKKILFTLITTTSILFYTCQQSELEKGEKLAKMYCGSCHVFPEPALLDKETWKLGVMPKMAFRMGLDNSPLYSIADKDFNEVLKTIPNNPLISGEDWKLILNYYQVNAPDSITVEKNQGNELTQFNAQLWKYPSVTFPRTTLIKADPADKSIWIGLRSTELLKFDPNFTLLDSIKLPSPPSEIILQKDERPLVLAMGIMDPNDQAAGSLIQLGEPNSKPVIDSLKRPVYLEQIDLNNDQLDDYIISEFGNYTGSLSIFQNLGSGRFTRQILSNLPGTRKTITKDFDGDGLLDIMALITQGDEQIKIFVNSVDFKFRIVTVLRFPPVYGTSYFELADFNKDGKEDILLSNGDNADFSNILKPYHGLRIFVNTGGLEFEEQYFFNFPGASQTVTNDFDLDGDLDIAAISFFPDFKNPETGFVFLENLGDGLQFKPHYAPLARSARWLRIEPGDIDDDGDIDLLLGSLNFEDGVPKKLRDEWRESNSWLLILKNNARN